MFGICSSYPKLNVFDGVPSTGMPPPEKLAVTTAAALAVDNAASEQLTTQNGRH